VLIDIRNRRVRGSQVDPVNALEAIRHGKDSRFTARFSIVQRRRFLV
jgi:hypothetical protein